MNQEPENLSINRLDKRIHVALPIRVTYWDAQNKPRLTMACTYDISARGARVSGLSFVKSEGEILVVERGRSKAFCRVVWVGEANSELQGQIGIQSVELERTLWECELRDMEETYEPIWRDAALRRPGSDMRDGNRRRHRRFMIDGTVELPKLTAGSVAEGSLKNLSEFGCLLETREALNPGTELKLILNVSNYDLSVKGRVRHRELELGVGVEFREIRKGDREVLQYLMRKLEERQQMETAQAPTARAASASL